MTQRTTDYDGTFWPMPKIPRYFRHVIITEKIDGTNATIYIGDDGTFMTGSRTRWITPENDNHGFSRWAHDNKEELMELGPGWHRGEWWGNGINRGYGLARGDKRFSLFNTKFADHHPGCVDVVPILFNEPVMNDSFNIEIAIDGLRKHGSVAAPGYMDPEGIVIYHMASKQSFKVTCKDDEQPKGVVHADS
jgi:hypothetical protein